MAPSKRSRISVPPTRPEFPAGNGMWDTQATKLSQNPILAMSMEMSPDLIGVQAPNPKSILSLGLATSDPAERSSPPKFGEFLKACRWCKNKIGDNETVYICGERKMLRKDDPM